MNDFRVKELKELLKSVPDDARVFQSSGEGGSILWIQSKNGKKSWTIYRDGKMK